MIVFEWKFDKQDFTRILKAMDRVMLTADAFFGPRGIAIQELATEYVGRLQTSIQNQKFVGTWGARGMMYNPSYEKWKQTRVGHKRFWLLDDDLYQGLRVTRIPRDMGQGGLWHSAFLAGIPEGMMDRGGKGFKGGRPKPIAMYGATLEWGLKSKTAGYHPPRPTITPSFLAWAYSEAPHRGVLQLIRLSKVWH